MFRRISTALPAALLAICLAAPASAENRYYGGVQYTFFDVSEDGADDDALLDGLGGRIGYFVTEHAGVELRAGTGLGTDDIDLGSMGFRAEVELDYYAGVYFRAGVPVSEHVVPYGIFGYTHAEFSSDLLGANLSFNVDLVESESDLSWGFGVEVIASEDVNLVFEMMRYMNTEEVEVNGLSFGITFDL